MSPPALIIAAGTPAPRNSSRARSAAQPLTRPVGSTPPGMAQGSNQPSDESRARRHNSNTCATSGGASLNSISPRRRRLTGLSGFHVLNTSSTQRSLAWALSRAAADAAPAAAPSASVVVFFSLRLNETTVPITCCEACIGSSLELVERRLQRLRVGLTRVGAVSYTHLRAHETDSYL